MKRFAIFVYGLVNYVMFLGVFLYFIGFLGNLVVPRAIDSEPTEPLWSAAVINLGLILVFGLQHTVMARPAFKHMWTKLVPAEAERSTYVLATNLALILLFWQWRPMGIVIWNVTDPVGRGLLYGLYAVGWLTVLVTTFLINHFDLFGLRQSWLALVGKPYTHLGFKTPGPYRFVRHPLYVGWLLAFWATPTMTIGHFLFALGMTAYILVAIGFEERDLADVHGAAYESYRRKVPMLVPRLGRRPAL